MPLSQHARGLQGHGTGDQRRWWRRTLFTRFRCGLLPLNGSSGRRRIGSIKARRQDMKSRNIKLACMTGTSAALLGLALVACGGGGGGELITPVLATKTCAQLNGMAIPSGTIGLPTTGATVTSTTLVAATGTGTATGGDYCKVLASVTPVDPAAPAIKFQLNLPSTWNNKAMMYGGGGFDGSIPAVGGNVGIGPSDKPTPLQRGYAVFGSDSGHQAGAL